MLHLTRKGSIAGAATRDGSGVGAINSFIVDYYSRPCIACGTQTIHHHEFSKPEYVYNDLDCLVWRFQ